MKDIGHLPNNPKQIDTFGFALRLLRRFRRAYPQVKGWEIEINGRIYEMKQNSIKPKETK